MFILILFLCSFYSFANLIYMFICIVLLPYVYIYFYSMFSLIVILIFCV